MPPKRKTRLKLTEKVLSSSSNSIDPNDSAMIEELAHEAGPLLNYNHDETMHMFNIGPPNSPMRSPSKIGEDLISLDSPIGGKKKVFKKRQAPQLTSDKLLFGSHRSYNFVNDKNERILLLYELQEAVQNGSYDPNKLTISLLAVSDPHNSAQLRWLRENLTHLLSFGNFHDLKLWFLDDYFHKYEEKKPGVIISRLFLSFKDKESFISSLASFYQALNQIGSKIMSILILVNLSLMIILSIVFLLYRFGFLNEETMAYLQLLVILINLICTSVFK